MAKRATNSLKITVRFGTIIEPYSANVAMQMPKFSTDDEFLDKCIRRPSSTASDGIPSISTILGCMSDKSALLKWQRQRISEMGLRNFKLMSIERRRHGIQFHKAVEDLVVSGHNGSIPTLQNVLKTTPEPVQDYVKSIYDAVKDLTASAKPNYLLEKTVRHPAVAYKGRFDAMLNLESGPCLIDWKTTSPRSAVAKNMEGSDNLGGLYDYPLQIAAYIAAFNSDVNFMDYNQIKYGAVVLAYDDGSPAKIVKVEAEQLQVAWRSFLENVKAFWRRVEDGNIDFICRDA